MQSSVIKHTHLGVYGVMMRNNEILLIKKQEARIPANGIFREEELSLEKSPMQRCFGKLKRKQESRIVRERYEPRYLTP